jgi:hypothetical protein
VGLEASGVGILRNPVGTRPVTPPGASYTVHRRPTPATNARADAPPKRSVAGRAERRRHQGRHRVWNGSVEVAPALRMFLAADT